MVSVLLSCSGCAAFVALPNVTMDEWISGNFRHAEKWVMYDPFTGVTYCPTCWANIIEPPAAVG